MARYARVNGIWYKVDELCLDKCAKLYHPSGEFTYENITDKEVVSASSFKNLDWNGTKVLDSRYETGWLSPNGTFYGCSYENHLFQALFIHNLDEFEIEEKGFIKLTYEIAENNRHKLVACISKDRTNKNYLITNQQYEFLKNTNVENYDFIKWCYRFRFKSPEKKDFIQEL